MDLQMLRHKWFPTDDGLDVCSLCAQPDLPEVGIFCPGPKPPVHTPKTATTEPPEWKSWHANIERAEQVWLDESGPITPEVWQYLCDKVERRANEIAERGARALEDFIARRVTDRQRAHEIDTFVRHCQAVEASNAAHIAELERAVTLTRAMFTPLPHDPPMYARLMPWRGKE